MLGRTPQSTEGPVAPADTFSDASERRRYYRIEDHVGLHYHVLEGHDIDDAMQRFSGERDDPIALVASLSNTGEDIKRQLNTLRRDLPDVATLLESLSRKVDTLSKLVIARESVIPNRATHQVSLSGSGMAFDVPQYVAPGSLLEIRLVLFPYRMCLFSLAAVVNCEQRQGSEDEKGFRIAVDFSYLRPDDQDHLIQHILRFQSEQLRRQRAEQHAIDK
ncbi:MAG: hypothetical protein ACI8PT_002737 [Gammaproteobacteria bacterium]|jgi:hypothetical protein